MFSCHTRFEIGPLALLPTISYKSDIPSKSLFEIIKPLFNYDISSKFCRNFQDNPTVRWDIELLVSKLDNIFTKTDVNTVVCFSGYGVSGHVNHIDAHKAVFSLREYNLMFLKDVCVVRKYLSIIDVTCTWIFNKLFNKGGLIFISNIQEIYLAYTAMKCHQSQFVWFRRLYFLFSRYIIVNDLEFVKAKKSFP